MLGVVLGQVVGSALGEVGILEGSEVGVEDGR